MKIFCCETNSNCCFCFEIASFTFSYLAMSKETSSSERKRMCSFVKRKQAQRSERTFRNFSKPYVTKKPIVDDKIKRKKQQKIEKKRISCGYNGYHVIILSRQQYRVMVLCTHAICEQKEERKLISAVFFLSSSINITGISK